MLSTIAIEQIAIGVIIGYPLGYYARLLLDRIEMNGRTPHR